MTLITGNTYPHREALRSMGGKWDASAKGWNVPDDRADEARALVAGRKATPSAAVAALATAAYLALVPPQAKPVAADGLPEPLPLDPDQRLAAAHASGWAVVAAGAGSGKTTTLVGRNLELIRSGAIPESVLTLVFNRDAASTGRARLAKLLGPLAERCRFLTFHAWGRSVLTAWNDPRADRIIGGEDGGPPLKPYAEAAAKAAGVQGDWASLVELSATIREALIDLGAPDAPDRVADLTGMGLRAAETAVKFAREFQRVKLAGVPGQPGNVLDFADMLCEVYAEVRQGTPRAKALCAAYQHVQVDELQDGNAVRHALARALGGGAKSLLGVGDLRQSVYGFTGARPDLFAALAKEAKLLNMPRNYRSGRAIVAFGNAICRGASWNLGGDCVAARDFEGKVAVVGAGSDQAGWVAESIKADLGTGVALNDLAVLARTNAALALVEASLHTRGIPARLSGRKGGIWASSTGRAVLAYLRMAEGEPVGDAKIIANKPCRYARTVAVNEAIERGGDVRDALAASGDRGCSRLARDLRALSRLDWETRCAEVAEYLLADLEERAADASAAAGAALAPDDDRAALITALAKVAAKAGSLAKLVEAAKAAADLPVNAPAVTLSTAHRAKGSEWRHVYVVGADEGMFPHTRSDDPEEERRLFYVACSRAADTLVVVHGPTPTPYLPGGRSNPTPGGGEPKPATYCGECGSPVMDDPDGSPGVVVHATPDGERDYDADADHAPVPESDEDKPAVEPVCLASPARVAEVAALVAGGEDLERAEREAAEAAGEPAERAWSLTVPAATTDEVASDPAPAAEPAAPAPEPSEVDVFLAAVAAAEPAALAAGAAEPKAADGSRYVPVALAGFEALLAPLGFSRAEPAVESKVRQAVYTRQLAGAEVRVYTTVPADGSDSARGCGEDSIKVAVVAPDGAGGSVPLMPRQPYACRTRNWRATLLGKVAEAARALAEAPRCPRCGAPMGRRKGPRGDFYGCSRYARGQGCRTTLPLPKDAAPVES